MCFSDMESNDRPHLTWHSWPTEPRWKSLIFSVLRYRYGPTAVMAATATVGLAMIIVHVALKRSSTVHATAVVAAVLSLPPAHLTNKKTSRYINAVDCNRTPGILLLSPVVAAATAEGGRASNFTAVWCKQGPSAAANSWT